MLVGYKLIIIGIASDNLMLSSIGGQALRVLKNPKWIWLSILSLVLQNLFLLYGFWLAVIIHPIAIHTASLFSVNLLGVIGALQFLRLKQKNSWADNLSFNYIRVLSFVVAATINTFLLGCTSGWLLIEREEVVQFFIPFLLLFVLSGFLLGRCNEIRVVTVMNSITTFLFAIGVLFLVITGFK